MTLSTYSTTTPADTDLEGDGAGAVRDLASGIKERLELDHNPVANIDPTSSDCSGYHNKVTLKKLSADPSLLSEDIGTATISQADPCIVTKATHGLEDGDAVYFTTTGALPAGLTASTIYYIDYIDANTFYLCDTYAHAIADSDRIATTDAGSGTHTLSRYTCGIVYSKDSDGDSGIFFINSSGVVQIL